MDRSVDRKSRLSQVLDLRLIDLYTTIAVLEEAAIRPPGARRRVAAQMGLKPSVVTDRVRRVEKNLSVELFAPKRPVELTPAGQRMAKEGWDFIARFAQFVETLQFSK